MTFFITVEIRDHTQVSKFFFLLAGLSGLSCVYSAWRDGAFLFSFVLLLLFILSGFIGILRILVGSKHGSLSLRFDSVMVFYRFLSLELVYGSVGRSIFSGDLLICLSYVGTRS